MFLVSHIVKYLRMNMQKKQSQAIKIYIKQIYMSNKYLFPSLLKSNRTFLSSTCVSFMYTVLINIKNWTFL